MRFLVTGGAGRLGGNLCRLISASGNPVRAFDLTNVSWDHIRDIAGVEIYKGDVADALSVKRACEDVDVVIHLAALLPPRSEVDTELTFQVNLEGTRYIVDVLRSRQDVPLIFASSISTYGITSSEELPICEEHAQVAHNIYSDSKIDAEKLIKDSGVPHVILRVAPIAVAALIELPDVIPYRPDQRVEFICLTDAVRAFYHATMCPEALGHTFNIAGGASWQMTGAEYIEAFYGALGVEVEAHFSKEYTAIDWYDTSRGRFLDYQRTTFNAFLRKLRVLGEGLGLR